MANSISGIANMLNNKMRFSGLSTGLDTDSIVKQLMQVERIKVDKAIQKRTLLEWKRDDYRSIINSVKSFNDTYMDVLSSSNMRSQNSYKVFSVTSSDPTYVTATASAEASAGIKSIQIDNLAKSEAKLSADSITRDVEGKTIVDAAAAASQSFGFTVDGVTKYITIDSTVTDNASLVTSIKNKLDAAFGAGKIDVTTPSDRLTFKAAVGSGVNKLSISSASSNDALANLGFTAGETAGLTANFSNRLDVLGTIETMAGMLKNSGLTYTTANGKDSIYLIINNKHFTFSKDMSLSSMMAQINSDSTANVNMQYDKINDKFVITSKQMGEGNNLNISENGSTFLNKTYMNLNSIEAANTKNLNFAAAGESFSVNINGTTKQITLKDTDTTESAIQTKINDAFAGTGLSVTVGDADGDNKLEFTPSSGNIYIGEPITGTSALAKLGVTANYVAGEDAKVTIDGQSITRGSNVFNVSGITYTLLKETGAVTKTITLTQDTDKVFNNIKTFVDEYNKMIDTINKEISEEKNRDYLPLTEEQKEAMSEEEIKKWEEKAKAGMLHSDGVLNEMLSSMRRALYDNITGISGSLYSIGITTNSDYKDKGKLVINETVLKDKLINAPDLVMNVFSKESSSSYSDVLNDSTLRTQRYKDNGIVNRLYDIIQDNIRTTRSASRTYVDGSGNTVRIEGKKGILIERAGIIGDIKKFDADIPKQIKDMDYSIVDMLGKLTEKENSYYKKFSSLERIMSQMNSQSAWLSQQFSGGQ
ncbi:MAG: flagellar filament capping protein FliD [Clostridia bacterium]